MSDSEAFKDAIDTVDVPVATSGVPRAGPSRPAGSTMQSTPPAACEDEITARLRRLQETRQQVRRLHGLCYPQCGLCFCVAGGGEVAEIPNGHFARSYPRNPRVDPARRCVVLVYAYLLASTCITDEDEFKAILHDNEDPREVENKYNSFGYQFFAALKDL